MTNNQFWILIGVLGFNTMLFVFAIGSIEKLLTRTVKLLETILDNVAKPVHYT